MTKACSSVRIVLIHLNMRGSVVSDVLKLTCGHYKVKYTIHLCDIKMSA